ncbi:MAG: tetratricopeptide repeat protein [Vicinamibacteria bacterium]
MTMLRALLVAFAILVPLVQAQLDARFGSHRAQREVLYVWSGEHLKKLWPGLELVTADFYWLRTVQYFGGERVFGSRRYELLGPLIDITVTLDPRFEIAYRYGATFLAEPWPMGAGDPEAAVRLLERGARALPQSWLLRQTLGFFIYFHLDEPRRAAEVMLEGARLPGAPTWFSTLAADFLGRAGDRETARRVWRLLLEQAEDARLRRNAQSHLDYLDAEELIERVEGFVKLYRARFERNPASLREMAAAGVMPFVPVDPSGAAFDYDPATGTVSISRSSPLWRTILRPRKR